MQCKAVWRAFFYALFRLSSTMSSTMSSAVSSRKKTSFFGLPIAPVSVSHRQIKTSFFRLTVISADPVRISDRDRPRETEIGRAKEKNVKHHFSCSRCHLSFGIAYTATIHHSCVKHTSKSSPEKLKNRLF